MVRPRPQIKVTLNLFCEVSYYGTQLEKKNLFPLEKTLPCTRLKKTFASTRKNPSLYHTQNPLIIWFGGCLVGWSVGWCVCVCACLVGWLVGWLVGRSVGRSVGCLVVQLINLDALDPASLDPAAADTLALTPPAPDTPFPGHPRHPCPGHLPAPDTPTLEPQPQTIQNFAFFFSLCRLFSPIPMSFVELRWFVRVFILGSVFTTHI